MHLSASGALPLWLQSQLDNLATRRVINILVWFLTLMLLFKCALKIELEKGVIYLLLISYCLSPMMISSAAWGLSEIYALFFIYLATYLLINNYFIVLTPILFSSVILCRQNLIGLLVFLTCFINARIIKTASIVGALLGLLLLVYLWGGLIPRGLERHMTPSLRTFVYSIAIFSLYFIFCKRIRRRFNFLAIILISVSVALIVYLSPDLLGGGYIFSRIEKYSKFLNVLILSSAIYSIYTIRSNLLIILIIISAITLSTTNYIFLKYIDFFVYFIFSIQILSIGYINSKKNINKFIEKLCDDKNSIQMQVISIAIFQVFSILLSTIYYGQ
jgi:hypothetical protein